MHINEKTKSHKIKEENQEETHEENPSLQKEQLRTTRTVPRPLQVIPPPPMGVWLLSHRHTSVVSSPSGVFFFLFFIFPTWVITPVKTARRLPGLHQKFVNDFLHKKVGNPIDNPFLFRYIFSIETKESNHGKDDKG